jgi:hypothetical protein
MKLLVRNLPISRKLTQPKRLLVSLPALTSPELFRKSLLRVAVLFSWSRLCSPQGVKKGLRSSYSRIFLRHRHREDANVFVVRERHSLCTCRQVDPVQKQIAVLIRFVEPRRSVMVRAIPR